MSEVMERFLKSLGSGRIKGIFAFGIAGGLVGISAVHFASAASQTAASPDPLHISLVDDSHLEQASSSNNIFDTAAGDAQAATINQLIASNSNARQLKEILDGLRASPSYAQALTSLTTSLAACSGLPNFSSLVTPDQNGSLEMMIYVPPQPVGYDRTVTPPPISFSVVTHYPSLTYSGKIEISYSPDSIQFAPTFVATSIDQKILASINKQASDNRLYCGIVKQTPAMSGSYQKTTDEPGGDGRAPAVHLDTTGAGTLNGEKPIPN